MSAICRFATLGALVLVLLSFVTPVVHAQDDPATQVLARINRARADAKLPPLARNGQLDTAAQAHADDLLKNGASLGHRGSNGSSIQQRILGAGYGGGVTGENWAAYRSLDLVFAFWLNDPPHRRNILNAKFTEIGIGIASRAGGGYIVITDFGGPGTRPEGNLAQAAAPAAKKVKATAVPTKAKSKPTRTLVPATRKPTRKPTVAPTPIPTQTAPAKRIALAKPPPPAAGVLLYARGKIERIEAKGIARASVGVKPTNSSAESRWWGGALALSGLVFVGVAVAGHRRRLAR